MPMWSTPPPELGIAGEEVHVWRAFLDQDPSRRSMLERLLSVGERHTAERFRFWRDRDHFVVARGILRMILGRYLNVEPAHLRFIYGSHGKPALGRPFSAKNLLFNVSHSTGLALFAIASGRRVGVDVEFLRVPLASGHIPEHFFSPNEVAALRALPQDQQAHAFYVGWTRKEAYLKARGDGLGHRLDEFEVTLTPGEPAALLSTAVNPQEASRWSLRSLEPASSYVGALAVEGHNLQLKCWQWSERQAFASGNERNFVEIDHRGRFSQIRLT
jgi:4'-phosphopantetheinyl transferase